MLTRRFIRIAPHPLLAAYVECYWMLEISNGQSTDSQLLPADGRIELMFSFAAQSQRVAVDGSGDVRQMRSCSFVLGARTQGYRLEHFGLPRYVAVRLKTGGLSAFTRLPLAELTDNCADLDCIWDVQKVRQIEDQLAKAHSPQLQAAILDNALLSRLKPPEHLARLLAVVYQLEVQAADVTMPDLAADINMSQKHFERLFARYIGFRPSLFARVARFQQAMYGSRLGAGSFTLGQVAAQLGYYDQAHFTKDFKRFSGISPNIFFAKRHEYIQIAKPAQVVELLQDSA